MTRKTKCNSESNSFVAAAEQVCLQPVLEHRQRRGRRNIAWQAIPHLCCSNRKGTTPDSWPTTGRRQVGTRVKLFSGGGPEPHRCPWSICRVATKWEKNAPSLSDFSRAIKLLFAYVITTKSKCNQGSRPITTCYQIEPSILADIYWTGSLVPEIVTILFTQSTAVLCAYWNLELKLHCFLQFSPEVAQKSLRIPRVFRVQRNRWVLQVCGHPGTARDYTS